MDPMMGSFVENREIVIDLVNSMGGKDRLKDTIRKVE